MHETQVQSLIPEDATRWGAIKQCTTTTEPALEQEPQLKPAGPTAGAPKREATAVRSPSTTPRVAHAHRN